MVQADTWKAIAHVPWMIKPLYGLITDSLPIWGRRRRPYLIICGLTGARSMPAPLCRLRCLWPGLLWSCRVFGCATCSPAQLYGPLLE